MTTTSSDGLRRDGHIILELGFEAARVGDEFHGTAAVVPEMFAPGTSSVRTSILATWADVVAGRTMMGYIAPRVPVTLDLDIHVHRPLRETERIDATGRLVKNGRSVAVIEIDFTGADGESLALGVASFMAAPDPSVLLTPEMSREPDVSLPRQRLREPFARRARCEIREPGVAVLPRTDDGLNAARTLNGGLIALAAEEAALSLTPGTSLSLLALRYLRPVRTGPAVATATVRSGLGRVEVRDAGDDRLAVYATTRAFPVSAD
ncbi:MULTISPECIES: PaaI family thioesterase [Parafrankia]|uniref:Thioesterase n=1 Tax=Parafrankia colletiae TaxID=573497 RepID=A0A1S1QJ31_9ACTN|nr:MULTISPECIES: PaaI family thioesterase [Parafrankia]MCK9902007.1 PaaI family thioesterase [Frankia sp. Cpl3]OHV33255.1 thioesterase [Parafrankia colletiae]